MATEISAKHTEFQAAVVALDKKRQAYEDASTTYMAAKSEYIAAIDAVDALDNELEALMQSYEPPAHPEPK